MPATTPSLKLVFSTWWPLAVSWLFMGLELPLVSAVMARLADPAINLAAYGGVVFPLALIIEAPIIMLLAASTALSRDANSYWKMHRFMMWASGVLTVLHILLAFTPLFDLVVVRLLGPPAEIVEPARLGLRLLLPWTWAIGYRRFNQGLLIRFGHSGAIGIGTFIRLTTVVVTMATILIGGGLPGIAVASIGIAAGVSAEAIYTGLRVRPLIRGVLKRAPLVTPLLSWRGFYGFYIPLALTSLLLLLVQPIGSAAIGRMPQALASLAAWPVLNGLLFLFRGLGFAYNEVVVALLERRGAARPLRRFTMLLASGNLLAMLVIVATPLADIWLVTVSGLDAELAALAHRGLWIGLLWPALDVVRNFLQGTAVYGRRTRVITESVVVFMVASGVLLLIGVVRQEFPGLEVTLFAFIVGTVVQILWLWRRSLPILRAKRAPARYAEAVMPPASD